MNAETFARKYSTSQARPISKVRQRWIFEDTVDDFLGTTISAGVLVSDFIIDDRLLDQIPPRLADAVRHLMGHHQALGSAEIRQLLIDHLTDDPLATLGFINKIKGQLGEDAFLRAVGSHARLAASGSQEAWDIAVDHADGTTQFVQVKLYDNADAVLAQMRDLHAKLASSSISDGSGGFVHHIDFAVPRDIADAVQAKVNATTDLHDIHVYSIDLTADQGAQIVTDGLDALRHPIQHLLGELFDGSMTAGALHAAANAFLVAKGARTFASAIKNTGISTGVTGVGIAAALTTESALDYFSLPTLDPLSIVVGIGVRRLARSFVTSRLDFADVLHRAIVELSEVNARLVPRADQAHAACDGCGV